MQIIIARSPGRPLHCMSPVFGQSLILKDVSKHFERLVELRSKQKQKKSQWEAFVSPKAKPTKRKTKEKSQKTKTNASLKERDNWMRDAHLLLIEKHLTFVMVCLWSCCCCFLFFLNLSCSEVLCVSVVPVRMALPVHSRGQCKKTFCFKGKVVNF